MEHLDYSLTDKNVAKAVNRALGLIIAKDKAFDGLPFRSYTKLFDAMVWSVINYGSGIWGTKQYSCINAIQTIAERYYLDVGKFTPNVAVHGETAWIPTIVVVSHLYAWKQEGMRELKNLKELASIVLVPLKRGTCII